MSKAISLIIRQNIVSQRLSGMKFEEIARSNQVSYSTACSIWRRYKRKGLEGLANSYTNCGLDGPQCGKYLYDLIIKEKGNHPDWGAPYIRARFAQKFPDLQLPSVRTIQNWFKNEGLNSV